MDFCFIQNKLIGWCIYCAVRNESYVLFMYLRTNRDFCFIENKLSGWCVYCAVRTESVNANRLHFFLKKLIFSAVICTKQWADKSK